MASIFLSIATPERNLAELKATWIQLPTYDGYMGFLPGHAPIVGVLGIGVLACELEDGSQRFYTIAGGYFELHSDEMTVLADTAESIEEIDVERAKAAMKRAEERILRKKPGDWDIERAQAAMMRSLNRIRAASKYGNASSNERR